MKPFAGFIETIEFEPTDAKAYALAQAIALGHTPTCTDADCERILAHVRTLQWIIERGSKQWVIDFYRAQAQHLVKTLCQVDNRLAGDTIAQLEERAENAA